MAGKMGAVPAVSALAVRDTGIHEPEIPEIPEIRDEPAPELDDSGNPEPDVPERDGPQPEIPEPKVPEPGKPEPEPPRVV